MPKKKELSKAAQKKLLRRWEKKADKALSKFIREDTRIKFNGLCAICQVKPVECSFHFITRKKKALRWDERNVIGACFTCNYIEQFFPDLSRAWYIRQFGVERYLALVDAAVADPDDLGIEEQIIWLQDQVKHFENRYSDLRTLAQA